MNLGELTRPDKPGSHYWRITFYNQEKEYVQADIFEVNKDNSLVFKRMVDHDFVTDRKKYAINHVINRELWASVTECNEDGKPLWLVAKEETDLPDADTDLELEALRLLIKSTNYKIQELNKRTMRNS